MKILASLLILLACASAGAQTAPLGAEPRMARPIGPIPGPAPLAPPDGAASAPAEPAYPRDPVSLMEGRKLFVMFNCSGCHGGHAGGGMGPSLRDRSWIYGNHPDEIFDSIAEGRARGMPAWGTLLPRTEIWKLVGYIKSLRTPQEPKPPR